MIRVLGFFGLASAVATSLAWGQVPGSGALFPLINQTLERSNGLKTVELAEGIQLSYSGAGQIHSEESTALENTFLINSAGESARVGLYRKLDVSSYANRWMEFRITGEVRSGEIKGNLIVLASGPAGRKGPIPERVARGRNFLCRGVEPCVRRVIVQIPSEVHTLELGFYLYGDGVAEVKNVSVNVISEPPLPPPSEATDLVNRAVDLMAEYSLRRNDRDWQAVREAALKRIPQNATRLDAYDVIYRLVLGLEDNHSKLIVNEEDDSSGIGNVGTESTITHRVSVNNGIGIISLATFGSPDQDVVDREASDLRQAIYAAASQVEFGWIVDLRGFGGGGNWSYTAGLCPLLRGPDLGAFKNSRGQLVKMWCTHLAAGMELNDDRSVLATVKDQRYDVSIANKFELPVAVLVGKGTASAGETLAVQFMGAPSVRIFGQPTAGLASGVESFELNESATLAIAAGYAVSRTGLEFTTIVTPNEISGDSTVLLAAASWILEHHSLAD